jgi:membrane-associated protease RseP (regulator of RpoE activity)
MRKEYRTIALQVSLFIVTFITTTLAGAEWVYSKSLLMGGYVWNDQYTWNDFLSGMEFSVPFLLILTVHEFGHYFTAMYHKVKATLPYYIPIPPGIIFSIGTLGAVIRIRDRVRSNIQHFDIGLAGPLAGFIVALIIIAYGFITLPPADYIFKFHPEYEAFGAAYAEHVYNDEYLKGKPPILDVEIGSNLLFKFFESFVADKSRLPNAHEIMHYPLLLAGFISLFFTSMNLLPIGQLDGGHITYGLFGSRGHRMIATVFFILLIFYSGLGMVNAHDHPLEDLAWMVPLAIGFYYICFSTLGFQKRDRLMTAVLIFGLQSVITWWLPAVEGYTGWMFFAFIVSRLAGIQHPPSEIEVPLDEKRIILGWIALIIFVICFSPVPLAVALKGDAIAQ